MKKALSKRTLDADCRDAYGFTVRPQHLQTYKEYATIYKEEGEERSHKWKCFLEQLAESVPNHLSHEENIELVETEAASQQREPVLELAREGDHDDDADEDEVRPVTSIHKEIDIEKNSVVSPTNNHQVQTWADISISLKPIERVMIFRVEKRRKLKNDQISDDVQDTLATINEGGDSAEQFERECVEESCHIPSDDVVNISGEGNPSGNDNDIHSEDPFPWKELEFLVHGGVPRYLRGEVWQAFVGVSARRIERYYQGSPDPKSDTTRNLDNVSEDHSDTNIESGNDVPEKVRKQIEKDLPRTFPGHPALDEEGRCSLRRVLLAYARHNPSVGYCQAMNFFAGLLLLMMPEESAFWTFVGIIDDYFEGYYSQEMTESQVDQLVFEELMREKFPKLVSHLDYLGVQVTWISGPWFLSIFVNMLPWESVLRVWDVLLFEGNRVMLFRTALALMELYGPAIGTTKDAADAISLLQSLAGSTFDSSQLVLTACIGFLSVTEDKLQGLREKHRPSVLAAAEERSKGTRVWKDPKGLATKLYSFRHDPESKIKEPILEKACSVRLNDTDVSCAEAHSTDAGDLVNNLTIDSEVDSLPDLQEQVVWLKVELCQLLEEKRSATLRAEELETALMEMVKQDNRRQLTARVEQLEHEVAELRQFLADKLEQEKAMLQVLMRVEQEQKVNEDARVLAEQDAAAQRHAMQVLQEKYEKAMASHAAMEKRVVMAESMLEATVQYESGQAKALSSPRPSQRPDSLQDFPIKRTGLLSFGMGWREKNKGKPSNSDADGKLPNEVAEASSTPSHLNGH